MKLLLVEDDARLAGHLTTSLRDQGFIVSHLWSRTDLDKCLQSSATVDIIVLDRLLGNYDAREALPQIKQKWSKAPVLVLSAISTPNERADLLDMGADDYLGKPFSTHELVARLRVLLRRNASGSPDFVRIGNLVVDSIKRVVSVGENAEALPAKEFMLLRALVQEKGRVWSKNDLLGYVWGQTSVLDTNVVEATIANLRKKLTDLGANVQIRNMRHSGYWLDEE